MPKFDFEGNQLDYTEFGSGPKVVVLLHGQLLNQKMQFPLAEAIADRGHRVITLDLLGHGASDKPNDMWRYSMTQFGDQVVALLDHVGAEQAVIGGVSLGANVALEVAANAPDRVRGMLIEMPVLDHGILAAVLIFTPLMVTLEFALPLVKLAAWPLRMLPRWGVPSLLEIGLDAITQDHTASSALMQGLVFGRTAPHRAIRRTLTQPTLVLGHPRDPLHPFADADMLVSELPNARLLEADSIAELRFRPARLTPQIVDFVDACWKPQGVRAAARRRSAG